MLKKFLFALIIAVPFVLIGCNDNNNTNPIVPDLSPTITAIQPNTFSRGEKNINLTITGTNLTGTTVVVLGDATTVHSFSVTSPTSIAVNFSIQRLAASGKRDVTVSTPKGAFVARELLTVSGDAPEANFISTPENPFDNADVEFDGTSSIDADGSIKSYSWDFGDGKRATGSLVKHRFVKGNYNVTLEVTDNDQNKNTKTRAVDVQQFREVQCKDHARNNGLLYGTVVAIEPGNNAIVQLDRTSLSCEQAFYYCGDMRDGQVDLDFYGIVYDMGDRGNGLFRIKNDCPYKWPPKIGRRIFLFWKACSKNSCP